MNTDTPLITSKEIRRYCETYSAKQSPLLKEIEEMSQQTSKPQMISGSFLGLLLRMICLIKKPKNVLEIGTFTGYGTLCLAEAVGKDSKVITIEKNADMMGYSKDVWSRSDSVDSIIAMEGDATEIIPTLDYDFDLVYIDAAKRKYIEHFDLVFPKLNQGAIVLADNVLWKGIVATDNKDSLGAALHDFNVYISERSDVDNMILTDRRWTPPNYQKMIYVNKADATPVFDILDCF